MLRSVKGLRGSWVEAKDGEIGRLDDLLFDETEWTVRYLVVDTGGWLRRRRVLLSPVAVSRFDGEGRRLFVELTRQQIEESPELEEEAPLTRSREAAYADYFGWPYYWAGPEVWAAGPYPLSPGGYPPLAASESWQEDLAERLRQEMEAESHLRSARDFTGAAVEATDGPVGHVEDLLVDDAGWAVRYLSVDPGAWWPRKKVLLDPRWIERASGEERRLRVRLSRERIRTAPEWDPSVPIDRALEERIYRHYGETPWWEREAASPPAEPGGSAGPAEEGRRAA